MMGNYRTDTNILIRKRSTINHFSNIFFFYAFVNCMQRNFRSTK